MAVAEAFQVECETHGENLKAPLAQVPRHLFPHPPLCAGEAEESWCSLHKADGPCAREEAEGYESRFDGTLLPEGGVNL